MTDRALTWVVITVYALFMLFVGAAFTYAWAHSWYDPQCCNDVDCHPVPDDYLTYFDDGSILVPRWGIVDRSDTRLRWSRDGQDHVCEMPNKLYCIYRKPPGS